MVQPNFYNRAMAFSIQTGEPGAHQARPKHPAGQMETHRKKNNGVFSLGGSHFIACPSTPGVQLHHPLVAQAATKGPRMGLEEGWSLVYMALHPPEDGHRMRLVLLLELG